MGSPQLPPTPAAPPPAPTPASLFKPPAAAASPNLGNTFLTGGSLLTPPATAKKKGLLGQ